MHFYNKFRTNSDTCTIQKRCRSSVSVCLYPLCLFLSWMFKIINFVKEWYWPNKIGDQVSQGHGASECLPVRLKKLFRQWLNLRNCTSKYSSHLVDFFGYFSQNTLLLFSVCQPLNLSNILVFNLINKM